MTVETVLVSNTAEPTAPAAPAPTTPTDAPPATGEPADKATTPPVDAQAEPTTGDEPKQPEPDRFAKKFAHLSKKENRIRQKEAELKEAQAKVQSYEAAVAALRSKPSEFLKSLGMTVDDFVMATLKEGEPEAADAQLKSELTALKEAQAKFEAERQLEREAQERAQYEQRLSAHAGTIIDHVRSDPDKYELIHAEGRDAIKLIIDVQQAFWERSGGKHFLPTDQAADQVEAYYLEQATQLHARLTKLKKLQRSDGALDKPTSKPDSNDSAVAAGKRATPERPQATSFTPTLTNRTTTVVPIHAAAQSERQRLEQAVALLKQMKSGG